jgi:hypothetical protein
VVLDVKAVVKAVTVSTARAPSVLPVLPGPRAPVARRHVPIEDHGLKAALDPIEDHGLKAAHVPSAHRVPRAAHVTTDRLADRAPAVPSVLAAPSLPR